MRATLYTAALSGLILAFISSPACKPDNDDNGNTGTTGTSTTTTTGCTYAGVSYESGANFDAGDDCNSCFCDSDGSVGCTEMVCAGPCGDGSAQVCVQAGTIGCDNFACVECANDDECDEGDWCRSTQEGGMACVPFVGPGESCQGYVLHWTRQRCEEDLICVPKEATGDIPGTCASCNYNGTPYQAGDQFDADDGCNSCWCGDNGEVACTKIGCPEPTTCHWFGEDYAPGETFDHYDGCNMCHCTDYGVVACTKIACTLCPPDAPPVNCFAEPCAVSSCDVHGAVCSNNYCGGCNAMWFDEKGSTVCE